MRTLSSVILILLISAPGHAQKVYQDYIPSQDIVHYGPGDKDVFPAGNKGYTLTLPDNGKEPAGVVLILDDDKPNLSDTAGIFQPANTRGWATLSISTGIPVDLYFSESSLVCVDSLAQAVFAKYHLPNRNIFLAGSMTAGHRALKYIEYCKKGRSAFHPSIKGVVLCESAIDWVRQWYECRKQARDHLSPTGTFEGNFITYLFAQKIRTTPAQDIQKFIDFSPYSYFDTKMEKMTLYKDLAIRAYTYADIRYWFSAQGKGIYDSNYPDMSGFINEQMLIGNKNASLIVYSSGLADPLKNDMRRQSTTWNLIDKKELIDWMIKSL
ncbi:MAG TPA: hypothetical protein VHD83_05525 [Puia sp.]|nr:hypothetical protein [Puia sp.]